MKELMHARLTLDFRDASATKAEREKRIDPSFLGAGNIADSRECRLQGLSHQLISKELMGRNRRRISGSKPLHFTNAS
jgi:hypothetical protein